GQEIVVGDGTLRREVKYRRRETDGAVVDIAVAHDVLRQVATTAAVGIGRGGVLPTGIIHRHAALPGSGGGADDLRRPAEIELEVVGEGNGRFGDGHRLVGGECGAVRDLTDAGFVDGH